MIDSMDIAFLLVNTSPVNLLFPIVTQMISSVVNPLIENNYDVHLALIKLKSDDGVGETTVQSFTKSLAKFKHWLHSSRAAVGRHTKGGTTAICKKDILFYHNFTYQYFR
jgi:hypothetical protein